MDKSYIPTLKAKKMIRQMADILEHRISKKFVLCGIHSGGVILGREVLKELTRRGIETDFFTVKLKKAPTYKVSYTNLPTRFDKGTTVVFLDDAIWTGNTMGAVLKYADKNLRGVKKKVVVLLDCGEKSDYSVY